MCPGRGAAFFTLLRRAGTHGYASILDPGSAAHPFALRSVRGTPNPHPEEHCEAMRLEGWRHRGWMVRDAPTGPREARPDDKLRRAPHHEDRVLASPLADDGLLRHGDQNRNWERA